MKIDVLTVGGSPEGVVPSEIEWPGVGGAELMLLRWAEFMGKRGHEIRIYNNPRTAESFPNVAFLAKEQYNPDDNRDVVISYRGYGDWQRDMARKSQKKLHIGWSTDQYTDGDYNTWYNEVYKVVGISEFHKHDHIGRYRIDPDRFIVIDIGADTEEYSQNVTKNYNQFIFCSVPDRGLQFVPPVWNAIRDNFPNAKLIITSDYGLWTNGRYAGNEQYKQMFFGMPGVKYIGRVPRSQLVQYQLESAFQLYPCIYDENFCIANQECQMAGAICFTSGVGALSTTNFTGHILADPRFDLTGFGNPLLEIVDKYYQKTDEEKANLHNNIKNLANERFSWDKICLQWEKLIMSGIG